MAMAKRVGQPLNEKLFAAGLWQNYLLSHVGSLTGAIELSGIDPKGLSERDFSNASVLLRNLLQSLDQGLVVTQYYWHFEGAKVALHERSDPRSQMLSSRRMEFLNNSRTLSSARLYWLLEAPAEENLNTVASPTLFKLLFSSPFEREARMQLKAKLFNLNAWVVEERELRRQVELITNSLEDVDQKLQLFSPNNTHLGPSQIWALLRALVNLNPSYLDSAQSEDIPPDDWDILLPDGDISSVVIDGLDCLKFDGAEPVYARIVSIAGYGNEEVENAMWARSDMKPVLQRGNYLIMSRFSPMSAIKKALMLSGKQNELHRSQMKFSALMKGEDVSSDIERKINDSSQLKKMLQELEEAANTPDRFGYYHSHVVLFDRDPTKLRAACRAMNTAITQSKLHPVWESIGQMDLFPMILPAYPNKCFRTVEFTTSQAGACSLLYKSSEGVRTWGPQQEEAIYILESVDETPFHYTPFIGDKCLILGVGPTRSGKTFMKNILAAHFMKFRSDEQGSLYRAIDVDPGSEALARFFKDDGGIFRIEDPESSRGFNAFASATGPDDSLFIHHLLSQISLMLEMNDSEELRGLLPHEQQELDRAIKSVLILPRSMQRLSMIGEHCSKSLKQKLSRWINDGLYANLFDCEEDGIGAMNKRVAVHNLAGIKDTPKLASIVMNEIFFRIIRLFEDPAYRTVPKFMEIDEAQYVLSVPGGAETAVAKARTWFKHGGGMGFWTQSPGHYAAIPDWATLRSSATTFIFMADQEMDRDLYKDTFHLKEGELDEIAQLVPRKQAYIIQREVGISKTVNLNVAHEEYAISTSRPNEAAIVNQMLNQYPDIDEAISHIVKQLFPEG